MIIVSIQFFYYSGEGLLSGWVYFGINLLNRANQGPFIRSSGTIPIHANGLDYFVIMDICEQEFHNKNLVHQMKVRKATCVFLFIECV
jgi:hypothetical protein